jgi:hypothetical protein
MEPHDEQLTDGDHDKTSEDRVREVDEFFADVDRTLPLETPVLSPEATTREGIYGNEG